MSHDLSRVGGQLVTLWYLENGSTDEQEAALRDLALILSSGAADPAFQKRLARFFDDDAKDRVRLSIKRPKGRPKRATLGNPELEQFVQAHVDVFDENYDAVIVAASARFGVSETIAEDALRMAREKVAVFPELAEAWRNRALAGRVAGKPQFAPLR